MDSNITCHSPPEATAKVPNAYMINGLIQTVSHQPSLSCQNVAHVVEAAQQWLSARWEINAVPVSLLAFQETYANPQREMQFANLRLALQAIRSFLCRHFHCTYRGAAHTKNMQKRLVLNDRHAFTEPLSMLNDNYNQLNKARLTGEIGARYDLLSSHPPIKTLFLQFPPSKPHYPPSPLFNYH